MCVLSHLEPPPARSHNAFISIFYQMNFRSSEDGFFRWRKEDYRQAFEHILAFFFQLCIPRKPRASVPFSKNIFFRHSSAGGGIGLTAPEIHSAVYPLNRHNAGSTNFAEPARPMCFWHLLKNLPPSKRWYALQREAGWVPQLAAAPRPPGPGTAVLLPLTRPLQGVSQA